jgi:hypothetical protein
MFTDVATPVRAAFPGVFVTGERIPAPSRFPTVMFIEADNYEDQRSIDNSGKERITSLMYEVTVFSNLETGKRSQCIDILSTIDDILKSKNASRMARVEGYFDTEARIYMVTARYRIKTDGKNLYTF